MVDAIQDVAYRFGAVPLGDGTVQFRIWAPGAPEVYLEREGNPPVLMSPDSEGFHSLRERCPIGARYRYRVAPGLSVPDPASRLQDGDVHDASIVVDTRSYRWCNDDWRGRPWTEAVLYEIHAGLAGGFRGVQERLAELAELGVTAIELMPVADFSGLRNWGYDGVLPYAPDCAYGTPEELKQLIDTAHGMGLMVLLDVVYNHFGPDGNYLGAYASRFFRNDLKTPWGPAIDFRNEPVRAFFTENALYWLREYRFDGLRLDAVHAISEPGWLVEMADLVRRHVEPGREVHLVLENDDNAATLLRAGFDAQWNDDAHHVLHHILTGETQGYYAAYVQDPTRELARVLSEGFVYQGQPSVWRDGKPRGEPSANLPPTSFVFFLQNHDQIGNRALGERLISLCRDPAALRAAIALQILAPHIPMLFMGEEFGAKAPFQYFTSFRDARLARAVRDGRRSEFAAFREFSTARAAARIPDPNAPQTWEHCKISSDREASDACEWRSWYRTLLHARRRYVIPHLRGARSVSSIVVGLFSVVARWRLGNGAQLAIYCNFSDIAASLPPGCASANEAVIFDTPPHSGMALRRGRLPPGAAVATMTPAG